jgi:RHS repeat-associated protein
MRPGSEPPANKEDFGMKTKILQAISALALILALALNAQGAIPSGAQYWVEPGAPGAPTSLSYYSSFSYVWLHIRSYAPSYQGCWNIGYRFSWDVYENAASFGGNPSYWGTDLGTDVELDWPDNYAYLCVYPKSSNYAQYVHPVSWFQEQTDKNLGEPPTCSIWVGNPVNTGTGNKFEHAVDASLSSPGIPLELHRYYNSQGLADHPMGYGWTHSFDMSATVVQQTPTKRVKVRDADGRALYFLQASGSYPDEVRFYGESGVRDRLTQIVSTGELLLRRKERNLTYRFSADGKLTQISDPNGNTLSLAYTGGLLTQVADNFGMSLTIQYDGSHIASVTDPEGRATTYQYSNGDLTRVDYPDGTAIAYAYSSHRLTDKRDGSGNLIGHWSYGSDGRVSSHYRWLDGSTPQEKIDFAYNLSATPQTTVLTRSTGTTTYKTTVQDGMRLVSAVDGCAECGGGAHKAYTYDRLLNLNTVSAISEGQTYTTRYAYDNPTDAQQQVGEVLEMREAAGRTEERVTSRTYAHRTDDPFLLSQSTETMESVVDPSRSRVVTLDYDDSGNVVSRSEAGYALVQGAAADAARETHFQYNAYGQVTQIDGPRTDVSDITSFEYYDNTPEQGSNRGRLKAVVNALGQRTEFSDYDANGNVGAVSRPDGVVIRYTYDERNRPASIANETSGAVTQYAYDARGNVASVSFPEGGRIDFTYNLADQATGATDDLGNRVALRYDVEGRRVGEDLYDPEGALRKRIDLAYDAYDRLTRITTPGGDYTALGYNERGDRTSVQDPRGRTTTLAYDALRRLRTVTQPLSTVTRREFDAQDNLSSVEDPNGNTTHYLLDDFGKAGATVSPDSGATYSAYDGAGNLTQRIDAAGTIVNYTYDALNRLVAVEAPSDPARNITYTYDSATSSHGAGRLTGRIDASGAYAFHYDAQGNLTREDKTASGVLYTTRYTYNRDNALTSITYPSGRVATYTLDATDRATRVDVVVGGAPKTLASAITHLPFGGITGLAYGNGLTLTRSYDAEYRVSSTAVSGALDLAYRYFADGSVLSEQDNLGESAPSLGASGVYAYEEGSNRLARVENEQTTDVASDANGCIVSAGARTLIYDAFHQLAEVREGGATVAKYTYNGAGERTGKETATGVALHHYDARGRLIAETDAAGRTLVEYVYLEDQPLAMIRPGEAVYYYHNDRLGTPQALTDESGAVAWKAAYAPFGRARVLVHEVENPLRLPGQYFDEETGWHYNYFRYYDPETGRYVTPDPIGLAGGINPYAYVGNDPINMIDPLGLYPGQMPPPPPGYNPNTWVARSLPTDAGNYVWQLTDPESGQRWIAHPEDEGHWRHWDDPDKRGPDKRWPTNSRKPWPNQKRSPYGQQSGCDPSGDAPEWTPPPTSEFSRTPFFLPLPGVVPLVPMPGVAPLPTLVPAFP